MNGGGTWLEEMRVVQQESEDRREGIDIVELRGNTVTY